MTEATVRPPAPHGASPEGPVGGEGGAFEFLPKGFDPQTAALEAVRRYPISCLAAAVAVGFLVGRHRGKAISATVAGLATNLVMRELNQVFGSGEF